MNLKSLNRKERERLRQRQEILDAALKLFSERGYYNVSMKEIAEKAEFAVGTLYNFFKNKEDLYKCLMRDVAHKFHNSLTAAIKQGDNEITKLKNYVSTKTKVFKENLALIKLYFFEVRRMVYNIRADMDEEVKKLHSEFLEELAKVFESAIKKGLFSPIATPFELAISLESVVNAFLFHWLESPQKVTFPEDPDYVLNIFLKPLLRCKK